jgi:hypothetical protein
VKLFLDPDHYKVLRTQKTDNQQVEEIDLKLLAIDSNKFRYKMQLINVDNQKDAIVELKISNFVSPGETTEDAFDVNVANFNPKNVSFQYGIE